MNKNLLVETVNSNPKFKAELEKAKGIDEVYAVASNYIKGYTKDQLIADMDAMTKKAISMKESDLMSVSGGKIVDGQIVKKTKEPKKTAAQKAAEKAEELSGIVRLVGNLGLAAAGKDSDDFDEVMDKVDKGVDVGKSLADLSSLF